MRPLTDDRPKCMVEVAGYPLIAWSAASARAAGCDDIVVVGGYRRDRLKLPGVTILDNPDFATTNMVYSLWAAREALKGQRDVIVSYSDIVYEPRVLTALMQTSGDVAVTVDTGWLSYWQKRFADPLSDAESLKIERGRIVEIGNKVASLDEIQAQYIGLLKFSGAGIGMLLDLMEGLHSGRITSPKPFEKVFMTDLLQVMIARGTGVFPAPVRRGWLEVDSLDDRCIAERLLRPKGKDPAAGFDIVD